MKTKLLLALLAITLGAIPATAQQAQTPAPDTSAAAHVEIPRITKAEFIENMNRPMATPEPSWILQLARSDQNQARLLTDDNVRSETKSKAQKKHKSFMTYLRGHVAAGDAGKYSKPLATVTVTPAEYLKLCSDSNNPWRPQFSLWAQWTGGKPSHSARAEMKALIDYADTPNGRSESAAEIEFAGKVRAAAVALDAFISETASPSEMETLRIFADSIKN